MSDESLSLTGNTPGNNNNNDNNNSSNSYVSGLHPEFINPELDPYDLGDPFGPDANLDENFSRGFLEPLSAGETSNFALDPITISNEFGTEMAVPVGYSRADGGGHGGGDVHGSSGATVAGGRGKSGTSASGGSTSGTGNNARRPAARKDSAFDLNRFPINDVSAEDRPEDRADDRDQGANSNGEDPEDSQQPRRSRATGEALALLISEFSKNVNPNGVVRKQLADATGMSERSVRIWFQNRRAKQKKMEKMHRDEGESNPGGATYYSTRDFNESQQKGLVISGGSALRSLQQQARVPIQINDNYNLVDCNSISIGRWQRIKSGYINSQILKNLVNLSPKFLNSLMFTTDLLIILSKKNMEMNYFFSGFFQNNKILFRIFYPLEHILSCSLTNQHAPVPDAKDGVQADQGELRLTLSSPPKFAVFFLNNTATGRENTNQWSICDDFSEGQQVNNAYVGDGGSETPHILSGTNHEALSFLNNFVLQFHQEQLAQQAQAQAQPSGPPTGVQSAAATSSTDFSLENDEFIAGANGGDSVANHGGNAGSAGNGIFPMGNADDFLLESLGNEIGGTDNLLGF